MSDRDLDKGGYGFQRVRTYLGPSLGWTEELVHPSTNITTSGVYNVAPGDSILLVDVAAPVTIQLPDVRLWVQQSGSQPATAFERAITVKDFGGNATNFNIVIAPFGNQTLDDIQQSILISVSRSTVKLIPLIDLTGWIAEIANTGGGGGSGTGDVFKAGNNTFTGTNTFNSTVTVPTPPVADSSQLAASTAFVKAQNYITGAALTPYALIASPIFTGSPQAPTPAPGDNTVAIATTQFVQSAIGAVGPVAPPSAEYITSSPNAGLTAERVLTNTPSITWDFTTPGQAKANSSAGGGNVSSSGTPLNGQFARWVTATTIEGITISSLGFAPIDSPAFTGNPTAPTPIPSDNDTSIATTAFVKTSLGGYQPLDGDLTAIAGLAGTNTIYYRSATDIWSPVTFSGLSFSGGVLTATAGGGNVSSSGTPATGQIATWVDPTHIQGVTGSSLGFAPINNPVFTGDPQAPTPLTADSDTSIATTGFVKAQNYAPLIGPLFSGDPRAPTPAAGDNDTSIATTAFITANSVRNDIAQGLSSSQQALARTNIAAQAQGDFAGMSNGILVGSAAAGALTVAVKTVAGADPSPSDPVYFYFRSGSYNSGPYARLPVTAALSLVIPSGATVGVLSGYANRIWISAHNASGTVRLGVIKCMDQAGVFCPQEHWLQYPTLVPGNSSRTFYTAVAIAAGAPFRLIGFFEWGNIATAGTWQAPDIIALVTAATKRPGDMVQLQRHETATQTSNAGTVPNASAVNVQLSLTSQANPVELFAVTTIYQGAVTYATSGIFCYELAGFIGVVASSFSGEAGDVGTNTSYSYYIFQNLTNLSFTIAFMNNNNAGPVTMPFIGTAILTAREIMG